MESRRLFNLEVLFVKAGNVGGNAIQKTKLFFSQLWWSHGLIHAHLLVMKGNWLELCVGRGF